MAWIIDNMHSHVGFSVRHMMVSTVRGQFKAYRGKAKLDPADFTRSSFEGEVDVASIDSGNTMRDDHLRASDIFDAQRYPKIRFKSTRIVAKSPGEFVVHGDLTIRGITRAVAFDAEFRGIAKNHRGVMVAGVSVTGSIYRSEFGIEYNFPLDTGGVAISEKVKIEIDTEIAYQEDANHAAVA